MRFKTGKTRIHLRPWRECSPSVGWQSGAPDRVSVSLYPREDDEERVQLDLSAAEARQLATSLLEYAAMAANPAESNDTETVTL